MAGESDHFSNRQALPDSVKEGELMCFLEPFKPKVLRVNSVFLKKCWLYAATAQDDFKVDAKYTFEIGGRSKGFSQIADVDNSYVFADDRDMPVGAKLPLWMLWFLYWGKKHCMKNAIFYPIKIPNFEDVMVHEVWESWNKRLLGQVKMSQV